VEGIVNESFESINASKLMKRMVVVAALIIIIIGIVFYRSLAALPFALGVLATSGLNMFKVRMLERTVQKVVSMDDQEAGKNVVRLQYLLRYLLTGIVLVAIGLIQNYTTPPPFYSSRESYIGVWAALFPNGPEALLNAPLISIWGALAGIFTLQISIILVRTRKLEKDGDNFIIYDNEIDTEQGREGNNGNIATNNDENNVANDEKNVINDEKM